MDPGNAACGSVPPGLRDGSALRKADDVMCVAAASAAVMWEPCCHRLACASSCAALLLYRSARPWITLRSAEPLLGRFLCLLLS